jgi:hypothetical protein
VADLEDQIESLKANINYLHENIQDCQQNILQMEQAAGKRTLLCHTDHKNPLCSHDTVPFVEDGPYKCFRKCNSRPQERAMQKESGVEGTKRF